MKSLAHARDTAEIARRLGALGPETPPRWGRMSAPQAVCHLADALRMVTDDRSAPDRSTMLHRTFVRWMALYAPWRWPSGIRSTPEVDQEHGGTRPVEFASDLAALQHLLERFATMPDQAIEGRTHPIFGRLSAAGWRRWGYLHLDHHLRQFGV